MKPVIGLLLVFVGLAVGYMVITGKLPSGQAPTGSQGPTPAQTNALKQIQQNLPGQLGLTGGHTPANIGIGTNITGTG